MRRWHSGAPGDHVQDLEVIRGQRARRGGRRAPESSIPALPLSLSPPGVASRALTEVQEQGRPGLHAEHAAPPPPAAGTLGTLGGASQHSLRQGRPSPPCAPPDRCSPGAGNPGRLAGGGGAGRGWGGDGGEGKGIAEQPGNRGWWSPGIPGGSGAARGVRSAARLAPCPLRPRVPAAGTWGKCWGSWRARAASLTAPRSAPRPRSRALAGGFTHHQPWLRSRLAATILFPSRSAGLRLLPATPPPPLRAAPPPSSFPPLLGAPPAAWAAPAPLHLITRLSRLLSCS